MGYEQVHDHGIIACMSITSVPMSLDEASERAYDLVVQATEESMRFIQVGDLVVDKDD